MNKLTVELVERFEAHEAPGPFIRITIGAEHHDLQWHQAHRLGEKLQEIANLAGQKQPPRKEPPPEPSRMSRWLEGF